MTSKELVIPRPSRRAGKESLMSVENNPDRRMRRSYISQRDSSYADCVPIAICNALRFLGRRTPRPGTKRWEEVVDAAGCRHGTTICQHKVADFLGAKLERIARKNIPRHVPVLLTVHNPEIGHSLHAVAVLAVDAEGCTVANYRVEAGPLIECVTWGSTPPLQYSDKKRVGRRQKDGSTRRVTVELGPLDRSRPWSAIYPQGSVYKITVKEERSRS